MKYYVQYIDNSSPLIKSFKSSKERDAWLLGWFLEHQSEMGDGYWVDIIFEGAITFSDQRIKENK